MFRLRDAQRLDGSCLSCASLTSPASFQIENGLWDHNRQAPSFSHYLKQQAAPITRLNHSKVLLTYACSNVPNYLNAIFDGHQHERRNNLRPFRNYPLRRHRLWKPINATKHANDYKSMAHHNEEIHDSYWNCEVNMAKTSWTFYWTRSPRQARCYKSFAKMD